MLFYFQGAFFSLAEDDIGEQILGKKIFGGDDGALAGLMVIQDWF